MYGTALSDLASPAEAGQVFSKEEPKIRSGGAYNKHCDDIALKAGGKNGVPVICANRPHKETQAGKKGREQSAGRRTVSNPLPCQANKER